MLIYIDISRKNVIYNSFIKIQILLFFVFYLHNRNFVLFRLFVFLAKVVLVALN